MVSPVQIVGGGLAGSEASRVLAAAGIPVRLAEMRPQATTGAHETDDLAEIVCSNSLGSIVLTTAKGVLIEELRRLGSLIITVAEQHAVPAGASLAVNRREFSQDITSRLMNESLVEIEREEVMSVPPGPVLIATGPLTGDSLASSLKEMTGEEHLAFYDSIAPIVTADSIDRDVVYAASRYGRGDPDYLNCPFSEEQYGQLVEELLTADTAPLKDFEEAAFFEGCLPVEEMARRGPQTLAFGPMRPVGLEDPRTGRRPHAVVQLRSEDRHGQLFNLVGFQTKLTYSEQQRVFRLIPGLEDAVFVRLGSVHRNTFINAPALLAPDLSLRSQNDVWFGGLVAGTEGYAECAALGLMAALSIRARLMDCPFEPPPRTTMIGGLMAYLREADIEHFQPMNVQFGLLPPLEKKVSGRKAKRAALADRALSDLDGWITQQDLGWLAEKPVAID